MKFNFRKLLITKTLAVTFVLLILLVTICLFHVYLVKTISAVLALVFNIFDIFIHHSSFSFCFNHHLEEVTFLSRGAR